MIKPVLLDLFCGAGGAAKGYLDAGFTVIGVDNVEQPRYRGDAFMKADALEFLTEHGHEYDAIHASPPCQRYSGMSRNRSAHPDLYGPTRDGLHAIGKPFIIENVIGAPYHYGFVLCGSMFGLVVRRHRNFETSWLEFLPLRCEHALQGRPITVTGHGGGTQRPHSWKGVKAEWPQYMQMPWATPEECTQAIPPAYTEYIGRSLMEQL
jgi:DNA (cytosine-5)-methyltransferase 1